jgi:hypothetical protein
MLPFGVTKCWKENKRGICAKNKCCTSRVAGYRFLPICLNRYTDKLYIFGKSITWLIEISISSLSSVVTLWDNLGQKSNPYLKKKCYQTLTISFLRTFFVIKQPYSEKNCWDLLIWVTGHCNRAAVSRNRYVLKKLLILIKYW